MKPQKKIIDHYKGFEGEPEIIFIKKSNNQTINELHLWIGYFNEIMEDLVVDNYQDSQMLKYHNEEKGWYEQSPWTIASPQKAFEEIETIDRKKLDEKTTTVLDDLLHILSDNNNSSIEIHYK